MIAKKIPLALLISALGTSFVGAQNITDYESTVTSPTDSGSGPGLFYSNATLADGNGNMQSTGSDTLYAYRLASMKGTDFFGNASYAFKVDPSYFGSGGVPISSSQGSSYLTGNYATVSFLFKSPTSLSGGFQSLLSRGVYNNSGDGYFEVRLNNASLQLGYDGNTLSTIGTLSADTWYYVAVSWDLTKGADDMTWFYGEAGTETLNSGSFTMSAGGAAGETIYMGGRGGSGQFTGLLEEVAIWDRTLDDTAIQSQFQATSVPEQSTSALIAGILALCAVWMRHRRQ